ncbi:copia protein [Tanacetum coccineum]
MELEPEIRVPGLECNQTLPENVSFVHNMVIKEHEHGMFFIDVFGDQAFQRMNDMHKVDIKTLLTYLVMASNITTPENTRFCLKLRKMIAEHLDQEKLKSKKVKLESVGYKVNSHSVSYLQDAQSESIRKTLAFSEAILMKLNFVVHIHQLRGNNTIVNCDNVSVVYLSTNPVQHQRTKHIEIDIRFLRDFVASGQVRVLHVPSQFQYADIFTKGLPRALFLEFRSSLNVRKPRVQTARVY